jgi:kelch-like protein 10
MGRLMDKAWSFILEHFINVAIESEEFLQINVDDLFSIITDELLNVKDEHVVWEALLRWIDFNPSSRITHLAKLMRGVRLGLLSNSVRFNHFIFIIINKRINFSTSWRK